MGPGSLNREGRGLGSVVMRGCGSEGGGAAAVEAGNPYVCLFQIEGWGSSFPRTRGQRTQEDPAGEGEEAEELLAGPRSGELPLQLQRALGLRHPQPHQTLPSDHAGWSRHEVFWSFLPPPSLSLATGCLLLPSQPQFLCFLLTQHRTAGQPLNANVVVNLPGLKSPGESLLPLDQALSPSPALRALPAAQLPSGCAPSFFCAGLSRPLNARLGAQRRGDPVALALESGLPQLCAHRQAPPCSAPRLPNLQDENTSPPHTPGRCGYDSVSTVPGTQKGPDL